MNGSELVTAIVRNPRFGVGDRGSVVLSFSTYTSEASAADHHLSVEDAEKVLLDAGVGDVAALAGKPCWVDLGTPGIIRFVRMWKP